MNWCVESVNQQLTFNGARFNTVSTLLTKTALRSLYGLIERRQVPTNPANSNDTLTGYNLLHYPQQEQHALRQALAGYIDVETKRLFSHNQLFQSVDTIIAEIYKQCWQVEFFNKWIKQNLKIKSFLGANQKNAVMTQIWVEMCVYLLHVHHNFWR